MESHPDRTINQNQAVRQIKERGSGQAREWASHHRKEERHFLTLALVSLGGSGQLAIYLSEWQTWWMALFVLLCIKRQLCTGLSFSQRFTKSWNLIWRKRMAGIRGGWRLTVCKVERESWGTLSPMIRWAEGGRGHRACVKVCFSVALLWLGRPQTQAVKVHSACAYLFIRMNVWAFVMNRWGGKIYPGA